MKPELEIHHINVSQGDSTLIINRNTDELERLVTTELGETDPARDKKELLPLAIHHKIDISKSVRSSVLIDAGYGAYGGDVARYLYAHGIRKFTEDVPFFTVASHFHEDHTEGLKNVFFKNYEDKKKSKQEEYLVPKRAYDCGDFPELDGGGIRTNYLNYVRYLRQFGSEKRAILKPWCQIELGNTTIDPDDPTKKTPVHLMCLASNGEVISQQRGRTDNMLTLGLGDQNDRSIVLVLEYGDFRYFFGGDLTGNGDKAGGNYGPKNLGNSHSNYDLESWIRDALVQNYPKEVGNNRPPAGHICCFTANHHGSSYANDVYLLETMKPTIALCSSGIRKHFHHHPTSQYCARVDNTQSPKWQVPEKGPIATSKNTISGYYFTEVAVDGHYSGKQFTRDLKGMKIMGDIIVRPISGVKACDIEIQVYGSSEMTVQQDKQDMEPREANEKETPPFNVGPFIHKCNHSGEL